MESDRDYSVLPSLSTLFADYDDFDLGGGPAAVDFPRFYKPGEPSRQRQTHSTLHPPFELWRAAGLPCDDDQHSPSLSSSTPYYHDHHMLTEEYGDWIQADELDMGYYDDEVPPYSSHQTETDWPTRSAKKSAARSFIGRAPSGGQSTGDTQWHGSVYDSPPQQYRLFSPESEMALGASFGDHTRPQPLSARAQPPHSHCALAPPSTSLSGTHTVSPPLASSWSPASSFTSPSSSPDIMTSSIHLHQPRPERPIPIIPLSELAAACEEFYLPPSRAQVTKPSTPESPYFLPLLSAEFKPFYNITQMPNSLHLGHGDHESQFRTGALYSYSKQGPDISCSCGCMKSYTNGSSM